MRGESASCIKAGYTHSNAGFMTMYTPAGGLAAQSFWYVHPDHPDTIVLDNIETNKGRDLRKVLDVYKSGLQTLLKSSDFSGLGITKVHLGEAYTDADFTELQSVTPIPRLNDSVYTDAQLQRLLLDLSNTTFAIDKSHK